MDCSAKIYNVLIAESFSCQRDLLLNLQHSWLRPHLKLFACHSAERFEILSMADEILSGMPKGQLAVDWLLQQCLAHQIQLVFIGKHCAIFENERQQFSQHGITLITGAMDVASHELIDDKYAFTLKCLAEQLPAIPAYQFASTAQFLEAYALAEQQHPEAVLCAKPVKGVFAHGFIRFKANANFHGLFTVPVEINLEDFCAQYSRLEHPPKYILMPFLTGQECSVDIACDEGNIISHATRLKQSYRQHIQLNGECDALCHQLVKLFRLDGLINIQFKKDADGIWHILEINARPAGGFAYSIHTGRNLIVDLIAKKLNLNNEQPTTLIDTLYSYPFTSSLSHSS